MSRRPGHEHRRAGVRCPQCDAPLPTRGTAQSLTCRNCDTDLHYDGRGKCRTLLRAERSVDTRLIQRDPTRLH